MNKSIYVAALDNKGCPSLIKFFAEKEAPKTFIIDRQKNLVHIIGNYVPRGLYSRRFHKLGSHWRYTAQEALELLRELTAENVRTKKLALRRAESEHGYVERFRLIDKEQANDSTDIVTN